LQYIYNYFITPKKMEIATNAHMQLLVADKSTVDFPLSKHGDEVAPIYY